MIQLAKRTTLDLESVGIAGVVFMAAELDAVYRYLDVYMDGAQIGRAN